MDIALILMRHTNAHAVHCPAGRDREQAAGGKEVLIDQQSNF